VPAKDGHGRVEARLSELGVKLPRVFDGPPGMAVKFELVRIEDTHAYISGHGPMDGRKPLIQGRVGGELTPEQGHDAARLTALSVLASLRAKLGDLDRVSSWVKVLGFVNAAPGFDRTPGVIDGFSDLIVELWGDAGRHARSAIGVSALPFDIPVEVEAIVRIAPAGGD
jgi:enamine deaminase RidA (YjgF/YER057c/UK114 family)